MPTRNGWLTPDTIPADRICRVLSIPKEYEYIIPAVMGALYPLTQPENWEQFGTVTPHQMAAAMLQMYFSIAGDNCDVANWPVGTILGQAGDTIPAGWLACDGALVSRATYAALFAEIGEAYGAGDGSTTFQLPDGRGTVMAGSGQAFSGGTNWPVGTLSGTERVTLSAAEMPTHTHDLAYGGYLIDTGNAGPMQFGSGAALTGGPTPTGSAGSGASHANVQPTQFIKRYIIYAGS